MAYITHAELAERPGAQELSQVASTAHRRQLVNAELLDAALRGADTAAFDAEQRAHAAQALRRIDDAVADAGALIDGFLAQRGYSLPLTLPSHAGRTMLTAWARAIARYNLHKHSITDEAKSPIARDYRDALRLLQQVADGKFSLGADDPVNGAGSAGPGTDVRFSFEPPVFGRAQLKGFR